MTIIILCNVLCIFAGRYIIQAKGQGPALPGPVSALGLNLPEFIATTSLGHIIGAGATSVFTSASGSLILVLVPWGHRAPRAQKLGLLQFVKRGEHW